MTESLAGQMLPLATPADAAQVGALAVDFRGDVELALRAGAAVSGYVFHADAQEFRLYVPGVSAARSVATAEIAAVRFAGTDAAAGKSWENWLRKVAEAERTGALAELYPEALD